ncbi:MAG: phosphotransferase [Dehalococcoidia bacterium]|nr:phosphotransferase [Dehalococcoidia bacterium]
MVQRLPDFIRRRPPPRALDWVERSVGGGARVRAVRRLRGGSSSAVHALTVEDGEGRRRGLVLRRYVRANWLDLEPDLAEKEALVLRALETGEVAAPRLVAVDEDGTECDVPAVLMERMPGRIDLSVDTLARGIEAMADAVARIHAIRCEAVPGLQPYVTWADLDAVSPPSWTRDAGAWRAVIEVARRPLPDVPHVLVHRDYHPGNVLWWRGRFAGITDWVNASCGPRGVDLGHCRQNIAQLLDIEAAERFLACYEERTGRVHDPFWDALSLVDGGFVGASSADATQWHDAGRTDITVDVLHARLDQYVRLVASRL